MRDTRADGARSMGHAHRRAVVLPEDELVADALGVVDETFARRIGPLMAERLYEESPHPVDEHRTVSGGGMAVRARDPGRRLQCAQAVEHFRRRDAAGTTSDRAPRVSESRCQVAPATHAAQARTNPRQFRRNWMNGGSG